MNAQKTPVGDQLVDTYLSDLRTAAAALPPHSAQELVSDIAEHIAVARADLAEERESDVRGILDRLGTPAEIAASAGAGETPPGPRPGVQEYLGLAGLVFGGLLPGFGTLAGLLLVSFSPCWTRRQRALAWVLTVLPFTLFVLFVALPALLLAADPPGMGSLAPWHMTVLAFVIAPLGAVIAAVVLGIQLRRRYSR